MNTFPSATTGPANPAPNSFSHDFFGPSFGQVIAIFSDEVPSRCGPRNCGQSSARTTLPISRHATAMIRSTCRRKLRIDFNQVVVAVNRLPLHAHVVPNILHVG